MINASKNDIALITDTVTMLRVCLHAWYVCAYHIEHYIILYNMYGSCVPVGYSNTQATVRGGVRWGTYYAFLKRAINRDNLHTITKATVHKVNTAVNK